MSEDKVKVASAKFDLGKVAGDDIFLNVDGHKFKFDGAKKAFERPIGTGASASIEVLEGDRLANALTKAFGEAEKVKHAPHAFDKLLGVAAVFEDVPHIKGNAAALESMEFVFKTQLLRAGIEQATKAGATADEINNARKVIMALLADGNFDKKHVPSTEFNQFTKSLGKDGWSKMQKTIDGAKNLAKEITSTTFAEDSEEAAKQFQRILAKHHGKDRSIAELAGILPETVSEHLDTHGLGNLETSIEEFSNKVASAKTTLEDFSVKRADLERDVRMAKKRFFAGDSVKKAEEALLEHDKEVAEFLKDHPANGAAFKETAEGVQTTLRSSSTINSAANDAVKGVGAAVEGKGSWFTHGADELSKIAKTKNVAVEKLGFWAKRTTGGKTALAGGALAVAAAVYAAVGSTGPGKRADEVRSQGAEPAVGAGR